MFDGVDGGRSETIGDACSSGGGTCGLAEALAEAVEALAQATEAHRAASSATLLHAAHRLQANRHECRSLFVKGILSSPYGSLGPDHRSGRVCGIGPRRTSMHPPSCVHALLTLSLIAPVPSTSTRHRSFEGGRYVRVLYPGPPSYSTSTASHLLVYTVYSGLN